jgi:hypothetical protein
VLKFSAEIRMLTVPALCFGVTTVHSAELVHVPATQVEPISAMSAPAMGRKPEPVTVIFCEPSNGRSRRSGRAP